jgi:hypothetical protein
MKNECVWRSADTVTKRSCVEEAPMSRNKQNTVIRATIATMAERFSAAFVLFQH